VAAAEAGLLPFLKSLPPEELGNFGFSPGDQLPQARIGDPWQLYTITPSALLKAGADTPVDTLISPAGLWYFPVILGDRSRSILVVDEMENGWEAVSLGKSSLAGEMQKLKRQWPKARGYEPKLIAIYQAASYFFTIPEKDSENFTPLTFDGVGFAGYYQTAGPEYSTTTTLSQMLGPLKSAVEKNISLNRQ